MDMNGSDVLVRIDRLIIVFVFVVLPVKVATSQTIDHWETVIQEGDTWNYLVPTAEPDPSWINLGYDDSAWESGPSGFGYGDDDDNTVISPAISLYIRKQFQILDLSSIEEMIIHVDFDDSFVAYLNGVEIAREWVSGNPPTFDQTSDGWHEAMLYQGLVPENYRFDKAALGGLLNQGDNVLAIQVHNQSITSSDMTIIPFLSVGINNTSFTYNEPPDWFTPPVEIGFTSSNLPIVVIDSKGVSIPDEPKVTADFGIIYNGPGAINNMNDPFNEYSGTIGVELRGESSLALFPKKNYGIEMWDDFGNDIDTSFLNFPNEEDFILHGPYSDKSLFNNALIMKLGNDLGQYASRTRIVELVVNDDYKGVYVLMERIKRDNERVDIARLRIEDIEGDQLTGGYIIRIDKEGNDGWESNYNVYSMDYKIFFQYFYPDDMDIQPQQKAYIQGYMDDFEDAIASPSYENQKGKHYLEYIDLRSFVDNFILNELSKNVDAYRLSTYFYKDRDSRDGRLRAGPLWDYNLAFGNGEYCGGDDVTGWEYYQCIGGSPFWWDRMLQDEDFVNGLRCRWEDLRQSTLKSENIDSYLDSLSNSISDAIDRNFQRWPILGGYIWPNSWFYASAQSHSEVIDLMKNWIRDRSVWLDNNIPGVAQDCQLYEPPYSGLITAIEDVNRLDVSVYPNPVNNFITIESGVIIRELELVNVMGQAVYYNQPDEMKITIDVTSIPQKGIYLLTIKTDQSVTVKRIRLH